MASTPFRHVSWGEEAVSKDKLEQMSSNDEYLLDNMTRASFKNMGARKNTGIKILAGTAYIAPNKKGSRTETVYFGDYFSFGCRPVVVTQVSGAPVQRIATAIKGIGHIDNPDHRGFVIYAWAANRDAKNAKIKHGIRIHWHAIGF